MTRSRAVYHNQHGNDTNPTSTMEADHDTAEPSTAPTILEGMDSRGRFQTGNQLATRKRFDLDAVLRQKVSAWKIAEDLIDLYSNREYAPETRLKALTYVYDRLAGRPRQSLTVSSDDSAGVIAMRQLYAAISGTEYIPPVDGADVVDAVYSLEPAPADPLT